MGFNSTIRTKYGLCQHPGCKTYGPLTKKKCGMHYWNEVKMKSAERFSNKEIEEGDLSGLIEDADAVFSKWLRLNDADKDGYLNCFICNARIRWQDAQCMHYIKRMASLFLRHDPRNCKSGCDTCNCMKGGNYIEYAKKLEEQNPGITEILYQEGNLPYHPSREELRNLISEYTQRIKSLK
jgi:hypothetical protein